MPEPERERGSSAGAWAAAALVLALGALIFAVLAHIRVTDLEDRVASLEANGAGVTVPSATTPGSTAESIGSTPAGSVTTVVEPPDAEQAKQDVIAAFTAVYDPAAAIDSRLRLVDDSTGVAAAIRQAAAGPNAAVIASVTVNVNDVQFVSPIRATVVYALVIPGQAPILGRQGEARVANGSWKVTRATVCADLDAVGGSCG